MSWLRRRWPLIAVATAATTAVAVPLGLTSGNGSIDVFVGSTPTVTGETANLWVEPSAGACTRRSTPVAYASSATGTDSRCGSFDTAYQAASAGDQVLVKAGSYSAQELEVKASAAAPNVVIQTASGETVTFTSLITDGADYATIRGPMSGNEIRGSRCLDANFTGDSTCKESVDDVFDRITLSQNFTDNKAVDCMGGCVGTQFLNDDICCTHIEKIFNVDNWFGNSQSRDMTIKNTAIHSVTVPVCPGGVGCPVGDDVHSTCMWMLGAQNLLIDGLHVYGCKSGSGDIEFSANGDALVPGNITIQNSIFEQSVNDDGTNVGSLASFDPSPAWIGTNLLQNNIFEGPSSGWPEAPAGSTVTYRNNMGAGPPCTGTGVTTTFNRWSNQNCGGTNTQDTSVYTSSRYVGAPVGAAQNANTQAASLLKGNWRWANCSQPGVDAGTSTGAPTLDFDAHTRPFNSVFDQGPFECGAT
jgi:hypothetical protein